jgi:glycerophosphoryl diester phosphodiesterase
MPRPLIYAHRGSSFDHPENTRAAFMAAISDGADGFECDLRLTKDNQVVIWHDSNMLRMANHKAVVAHTNYSELKEIYPDLMLLTELLEIASEHKKSLALETKHPVPSGNEVENKIMELVKPLKI